MTGPRVHGKIQAEWGVKLVSAGFYETAGQKHKDKDSEHCRAGLPAVEETQGNWD